MDRADGHGKGALLAVAILGGTGALYVVASSRTPQPAAEATAAPTTVDLDAYRDARASGRPRLTSAPPPRGVALSRSIALLHL